MKVIKGYDLTQSQVVNAVTSVMVDCGLVPDRLKLKLTHFANYVGDVAAWSYIQWDLLENYGLDPVINAIKDQLGTQYFPRELGYQPVLMGGTRIFMKLTNTHATNNYAVGFSLKGFYFVD